MGLQEPPVRSAVGVNPTDWQRDPLNLRFSTAQAGHASCPPPPPQVPPPALWPSSQHPPPPPPPLVLGVTQLPTSLLSQPWPVLLWPLGSRLLRPRTALPAPPPAPSLRQKCSASGSAPGARWAAHRRSSRARGPWAAHTDASATQAPRPSRHRRVLSSSLPRILSSGLEGGPPSFLLFPNKGRSTSPRWVWGWWRVDAGDRGVPCRAGS